MDPNTIRILSLDGGGVRGYLSLVFLKRFIHQAGIDGSELWKYFDVIAGTSIGRIQALGYAYGRSPEYMEPFFLEDAGRLFTTDGAVNSKRVTGEDMFNAIIHGKAFYESPNPSSNFGHNILQQVLVENFADDKLLDLKTKVVIPAYDNTHSRYVMFSNDFNHMFRGQTSKIVDVARATSAAPIFLPSHSFVDKDGVEHEYADGGVYQNNPADTALSLGKILKPNAKRFCVLSLGTGATAKRFGVEDIEESEANRTIEEQKIFDAIQPISNKKAQILGVLLAIRGLINSSTIATLVLDDVIDKLDTAILYTNHLDEYAENSLRTALTVKNVIDIASGGSQESINFNLQSEADNTLEQLYYYRFQPVLDPSYDPELDNSSTEFQNYMRDTANNHFTNDIIKINNFISHLKL